MLSEKADPQLVNVEVRAPVDSEALISIDAVGICHTDVSVAARWPARKLPMVFGHEGVGTVIAVDTTALPAVIATALAALRACGALVLGGLTALTADLPVGLIMAKGLLVRGVVEGDGDPHVFIPRRAVASRRAASAEDGDAVPFDDFGAAWTAAVTASAIKPVITMPH